MSEQDQASGMPVHAPSLPKVAAGKGAGAYAALGSLLKNTIYRQVTPEEEQLLALTIRLFMIVGGASFIPPFVSGYPSHPDPGLSYPYPTQADVLDGDKD